MNEIPVTMSFDQTMLPHGSVRLTDSAKEMFELGYVSGVTYVLSPGFEVIERDMNGDATKLELIELSIIPAERAIPRSTMLQICQDEIKREQEDVAEWFKDGIPHGYTADSWLVAYRFANKVGKDVEEDDR